MTDFPPAAPAYDAFEAAARSLREAELRRDLTAEEIPAPAGVAPRAIAFAGDVHPPDHGIDSQLGTGRFILLHDPEQPEPWDGDFRIVVYAQAPLEREIGSDPLLPEVAWSWLIGALEDRGARFHAASGTATTVLSTGFGALAEQDRRGCRRLGRDRRAGRERAHRAARLLDPRRHRPLRSPSGLGRVPLRARRAAADHRGRRASRRPPEHA